ncbi:MAG: PQQ-binding-like beta-propeller repeat protein [Polyangiaceae bacterium]
MALHPRFGSLGSATPISTEQLRVGRFDSHGLHGWLVDLPGKKPLATPAVADGRVYVGGGFGSHEFYCFDARSGEPVWALRVSDDGPSAAVVDEGCVAFNTESCTLFVVDARTGAHRWSRWLGDPLLSQPAAHNGTVYMAYPAPSGSHLLAAFALRDGTLRWEAAIPSDVISAPIVAGDSIYYATFDGSVHRRRARDGALVYSRPMNATSAPWISGEEVHVAQRGADERGAPVEGFSAVGPRGDVHVTMRSQRRATYLDPTSQARTSYARETQISDASVGFASGPPPSSKASAAAANVGQSTVRGLWEYQGSRPTVIGQTAWVTHGTAVRALDARTGDPRWEQPLRGDASLFGGHLASPPAYARGGVIAVGTVTGEIVLYDAPTGRIRAVLPVGQAMRFQPTIAGGRVFAGTTAGTLIAFDTGDPALDGWPMWGGDAGHNGGALR